MKRPAFSRSLPGLPRRVFSILLSLCFLSNLALAQNPNLRPRKDLQQEEKLVACMALAMTPQQGAQAAVLNSDHTISRGGALIGFWDPLNKTAFTIQKDGSFRENTSLTMEFASVRDVAQEPQTWQDVTREIASLLLNIVSGKDLTEDQAALLARLGLSRDSLAGLTLEKAGQIISYLTEQGEKIFNCAVKSLGALLSGTVNQGLLALEIIVTDIFSGNLDMSQDQMQSSMLALQTAAKAHHVTLNGYAVDMAGLSQALNSGPATVYVGGNHFVTVTSMADGMVMYTDSDGSQKTMSAEEFESWARNNGSGAINILTGASISGGGIASLSGLQMANIRGAVSGPSDPAGSAGDEAYKKAREAGLSEDQAMAAARDAHSTVTDALKRGGAGSGGTAATVQALVNTFNSAFNAAFHGNNGSAAINSALDALKKACVAHVEANKNIIIPVEGLSENQWTVESMQRRAVDAFTAILNDPRSSTADRIKAAKDLQVTVTKMEYLTSIQKEAAAALLEVAQSRADPAELRASVLDALGVMLGSNMFSRSLKDGLAEKIAVIALNDPDETVRTAALGGLQKGLGKVTIGQDTLDLLVGSLLSIAESGHGAVVQALAMLGAIAGDKQTRASMNERIITRLLSIAGNTSLDVSVRTGALDALAGIGCNPRLPAPLKERLAVVFLAIVTKESEDRSVREHAATGLFYLAGDPVLSTATKEGMLPALMEMARDEHLDVSLRTDIVKVIGTIGRSSNICANTKENIAGMLLGLGSSPATFYIVAHRAMNQLATLLEGAGLSVQTKEKMVDQLLGMLSDVYRQEGALRGLANIAEDPRVSAASKEKMVPALMDIFKNVDPANIKISQALRALVYTCRSQNIDPAVRSAIQDLVVRSLKLEGTRKAVFLECGTLLMDADRKFSAAEERTIYDTLKQLTLHGIQSPWQIVAYAGDDLGAGYTSDSDIIFMYSGGVNSGEFWYTTALVHEMGHRVEAYQLTNEQRSSLSTVFAVSNRPQDYASDYAMTNSSEDFAETLSFYFADTAGLCARAQAGDQNVLGQKLDFIASLFGKGNITLGGTVNDVGKLSIFTIPRS